MSNYQTEIEQRAQMFKALANPHRLALFHRLTTCCAPGTACSTEAMRHSVGELGEGLDIAPSTLSHHLKELNRAGLVQMQRRGKQVECWVEPATLEQLAAFFCAGA
jgi:DNA-binding transcriptional ArsR family regulator